MAPSAFSRLSSAITLVSAVVITRSSRVDALHASPRATIAAPGMVAAAEPAITTLPHYAMDIVPWPLELPAPTPAPGPDRLFGDRGRGVLRRQDFNTVCGFLGGNKDLPATCGGGSHCVLAPEEGAIGCCPDVGPCTTGVFTSCVDVNSPPQTEVNPYVYTCTGADVCYQNIFDGGFSQFGCGTATDLATSVRTATLPLTSISVPFTAPAETLSTPTTIGHPTTSSPRSTTRSSSTRSSSSTSTTRSSTTSSSASSSTSSRSSTSATSSSLATGPPTSAPTADGPANGADNSVAIIGGVISGVAILIAVLIVAFTVWRRRRGNERDGPGGTRGGGPVYIPPTGGHGFTPVQNQEPRFESNSVPPMAMRYDDMPEYGARDAGPPNAVAGAAYGSPRHDGHSPPQPATVGGSGRFENDRVPLNAADAEMEEFRQGYHEAIERIEPDDQPASQPPKTASERPLWQQNRRLSRSLMWI